MNYRLFCVAALTFLVGVSGPVYARECAHGNSGVPQDGYASANGRPYGWGLTVFPDMASNWVHYSIQTDSEAKLYDMVRIRLTRESCVDIYDVHVWSGESRFATFELGVDYSSTPTGGAHYLELQLPSPTRAWNGLGVSLNVANGDAGGPGCGSRIDIHSVCAFEH